MSIYTIKNHFADINAFYALNLTEFHMNFHTHSRCEIMYVVNGSCKVQIPDDEFELGSRQFIFLDADQPHKLLVNSQDGCSILNIEFSCGEHPTNLDLSEVSSQSSDFSDFLLQKYPYYVGIDSESLGYALKDLISRLQKTTQSNQYLIRLLFYRVLLEFSLCCQKQRNSGSVLYINKARSYIQEHLTEDLRIPQIAEYAGINKSYLHALFSRYMNCTIIDYINQSRLAQAAFLLTNSSLSVTDISFQSGYNSRQHFSATFEKYYNMTPRAYRQLNQKYLNTSTGNAQVELHSDGIVTENVFPTL